MKISRGFALASLMNLSGAHGPFFTRNIVILKDSSATSASVNSPVANVFVKRWKTPVAVSAC